MYRHSTSGDLDRDPISREDVLDLLCASVQFARGRKNKEVATEIVKELEGVFHIVKCIPKMELPDGKKLHKAYYPIIKIKDEVYEEERQIGGNSHDVLRVMKREDGTTYLAYENLQCGESTNGGAYRFVGERVFPDDNFDIAIPFKEVWEEDED